MRCKQKKIVLKLPSSTVYWSVPNKGHEYLGFNMAARFPSPHDNLKILK